MFKSLTSFIFGANTSVNVNQDQLKQEEEEKQQEQPEQQQQLPDQQKQSHLVNVENTIAVDSCRNSITAGPSTVNKKNNRAKGRGKNRRNNNNNKRKEVQESSKQVPLLEQEREKEKRERKQTKSLPSITRLLTPNNEINENLDEDNDDDWIILEKEDEADSLPRLDSEEELSVVEVRQPVEQPVAASFTAASVTDSSSDTPTNAVAAAAPIAVVAPALRRRQIIGSHSLYSGPRPQQQRNYLQRSRSGRLHSLSTSSPSRSVASILDDDNKSPEDAAASASAPSSEGLGWGGMTQSLYVASPIAPESGFPVSMEESWFVTPPPCFTSIGPIDMETSPYENLLIEHPSMSVYYSIRSAQEATQRFVNLDLGVKEAQQQQQQQQQQHEQKRQRDEAEQMKKLKPKLQKEMKTQKTKQQQQQQQQQLKQGEDAPEAKSAVVPRRPSAARIDRFTAAQLKQELLARSNQKSHVIQEQRQAACRGAILRANRVRDYQSKGKPQRRADMQHFRLVSGANNNRKCCC